MVASDASWPGFESSHCQFRNVLFFTAVVNLVKRGKRKTKTLTKVFIYSNSKSFRFNFIWKSSFIVQINCFEVWRTTLDYSSLVETGFWTNPASKGERRGKKEGERGRIKNVSSNDETGKRANKNKNRVFPENKKVDDIFLWNEISLKTTFLLCHSCNAQFSLFRQKMPQKCRKKWNALALALLSLKNVSKLADDLCKVVLPKFT